MFSSLNSDTIVSLTILIAIIVVYVLAKRDGRNNPINTGPLKRAVDEIDKRLGRVETELEMVTAAIDQLPTAAQVEAVRGDVRVVCSRVDGLDDFIERTDNSVVRIEQLLMGQSPIASIAARRNKR